MVLSSEPVLNVISREELEEREERWLAPYAMKSRRSRGRQHPEPEDRYRTAFRRDRDRIIHTTAFRRLEYKTQVFVNHEGDHYRTRLTHTLEVAQIGVSIARILRLNEDLVDVVALAHDIGHPPFGHAGEEALRELMVGHGGFDHNLQGLRIVDLLEARYPGFPGLNLTWEVRESINKHRTPYDPSTRAPALAGDPSLGMSPQTSRGVVLSERSESKDGGSGAPGLPGGLHQPDLQVALDPACAPLLESQIADVADEIAYDNHDLDDGLASGILKEEDLLGLELWRQASEAVESAGLALDLEIRKYQIIRSLINRQISDLIDATVERLRRHHISVVEDVRASPERLVGFSEGMGRLREPLKQLLWHQFYHHYRVVRMADKAKRFITELFHLYLKKPEQLPNTTRSRITRGEDPHRVICDYIAGMTDRYCLEEYKKLFDPFERV